MESTEAAVECSFAQKLSPKARKPCSRPSMAADSSLRCCIAWSICCLRRAILSSWKRGAVRTSRRMARPSSSILGEQVQAHAALVLADAGLEPRGQERQPLLQGFGGLRLCAAPGQEVAGQVGQALLAGGLQVRAGVGIDGHVDQRQFAVRHHVGDGTALEWHAKLLRRRRLIHQRRHRSASPGRSGIADWARPGRS